MKRALRIVFSIAVVLSLLLIWRCIWGPKSLFIQTPNGTIHYYVEQALTPEQQRTGLMHRKRLSPKTGMIFLFKPLRIAHMWMKNTLIPLDMVFFDRFGRVVNVHHNAIPGDETIISSQRPVAGVLEINAGEASQYGIGLGSTLDLSSLK